MSVKQMFEVLSAAGTVPASVVGVALLGRQLESNRGRLGLSRAEYRELCRRADEIEREEDRLRHTELSRYVAGPEVGYVTELNQSLGGLSMTLSDGQQLALAGISVKSQRRLIQLAQRGPLRPAVVERDALRYRLSFLGRHGESVDCFARVVALH